LPVAQRNQGSPPGRRPWPVAHHRQRRFVPVAARADRPLRAWPSGGGVCRNPLAKRPNNAHRFTAA